MLTSNFLGGEPLGAVVRELGREWYLVAPIRPAPCE